MRLDQAKEGSTIRVISIEGGRGMRVRLTKLGIHPGDTGRVERSRFGPILLRINGNCIALGRGVAARIRVRVE
jgi:ferrous iron transport protein A